MSTLDINCRGVDAMRSERKMIRCRRKTGVPVIFNVCTDSFTMFAGHCPDPRINICLVLHSYVHKTLTSPVTLFTNEQFLCAVLSKQSDVGEAMVAGVYGRQPGDHDDGSTRRKLGNSVDRSFFAACQVTFVCGADKGSKILRLSPRCWF